MNEGTNLQWNSEISKHNFEFFYFNIVWGFSYKPELDKTMNSTNIVYDISEVLLNPEPVHNGWKHKIHLSH